jgi:signal transduction histidine kinase
MQGEYIWLEDYVDNEFDSSGRPVRSIVRSRDVSDRVQSELALEERDAHYNALLAHLNAGIVIHAPDSSVLSANERALELLGVDMSSIQGNGGADPGWFLINEAGGRIPADEYPVNLVISTRDSVSDLVLGIINDVDDPPKWCLVHAYPEFIDGGEIRQIVVTFIDITRQKLVEEELRRLNRTKDRFFRIIAHDLRNSAMTLGTGIRMLCEELEEQHSDLLNTLSGELSLNAQELSKLLENLLEWSQLQQGTMRFSPKPLELGPLVEEHIEQFSPGLSQKRIKVTSDLDGSPKVEADARMLQTVLRNLLSNAIKFTNTGGEIRIAVATIDGAAQITIGDTGVGMNKSVVESLFSTDVDVRRSGTSGEKGSGLGLILCKEFVELHGGQIDVESSPGQGSIFRVSIPLIQNPA